MIIFQEKVSFKVLTTTIITNNIKFKIIQAEIVHYNHLIAVEIL